MKKTVTMRSIGKMAHSQLSVTQSTSAPTRYTKRIPTVKKSWKKAPRAPRSEVSAISEMNIGATTQEAPVAIPAKILPPYSMPTFDARASRAQLMR